GGGDVTSGSSAATAPAGSAARRSGTPAAPPAPRAAIGRHRGRAFAAPLEPERELDHPPEETAPRGNAVHDPATDAAPLDGTQLGRTELLELELAVHFSDSSYLRGLPVWKHAGGGGRRCRAGDDRNTSRGRGVTSGSSTATAPAGSAARRS